MTDLLLTAVPPGLAVALLVAMGGGDPGPAARAGTLAWGALLFVALGAGLVTARDQWWTWRRDGTWQEARLTGRPAWRLLADGPASRLRATGWRLLPWLVVPALSWGWLGWGLGEVLLAAGAVLVWAGAGVAVGLGGAARGWPAGPCLVGLLGIGALVGPWWEGPGGGTAGLSGWLVQGLGRWTAVGALLVDTPRPGLAWIPWWGAPALLLAWPRLGSARR